MLKLPMESGKYAHLFFYSGTFQSLPYYVDFLGKLGHLLIV